LTAAVWKDKRQVSIYIYTQTDRQQTPTEGNFCDEHRNAVKPAAVESYNMCMGYVNKSD
jgi:hypothetical protein